jgi:sortase A
VNWSRIIGNVGRTLIASGVLILLFVVYQLWGTALQERRAQGDLRNEFAELLESSSPEAAPLLELDTSELPARVEPEAVRTAAAEADVDESAQPTGGHSGAILVDPSALIIDPTATVFGPPPPPPEGGDAVAQLRIPAIGVDKVVVEGVGTNALKQGPGHYPGTPLPGQPGNAAIAAHRTTYGAPFFDLDELDENDLVYVTTAQGAFQYIVTESFIVKPSDVWVLDNTEDDRLTLTTCHPRYSARERLVVVAELIGPAAPIDPTALGGGAVNNGALPGEDVGGESLVEQPVDGGESTAEPPSGAETNPEPQSTSTTEAAGLVAADDSSIEPPAATTAVDGLVSHLDGDRAAVWPALFWGALAAFVWTLTWYVGKRWRRWPAYAMGGVVFLVVLFVFFENFSRLLPPGV